MLWNLQVAMATAQVIFQRFYYSKSLVKHDGEVRKIKFVHAYCCQFSFEVQAKLKLLSLLQPDEN